MNRRMPGLPVHHQLPGFTQTHVHQVGDAIQPSHPLLPPSPLALKIALGYFQRNQENILLFIFIFLFCPSNGKAALTLVTFDSGGDKTGSDRPPPPTSQPPPREPALSEQAAASAFSGNKQLLFGESV